MLCLVLRDYIAGRVELGGAPLTQALLLVAELASLGVGSWIRPTRTPTPAWVAWVDACTMRTTRKADFAFGFAPMAHASHRVTILRAPHHIGA